MKILLLTISIFTLGLLNIKAQAKGEVEFGIGVGFGTAEIRTTNHQNNYRDKFVYNIGLSGEYYFSNRWGLKMKLLFDNKGTSNYFVLDDKSNIVATDLNLSYITVPIMASWHFSKRKRWYFSAGTYLGWLTSSKESELGKDMKSSFKTTDFGLAFNIGYKFEISDKTKLFIEMDYQGGLTETLKVPTESFYWNSRGNYCFGVLFNL